MDSCGAEVNAIPAISDASAWVDYPFEKVVADATRACELYGAYKVRCAAIEQLTSKYDELRDVDLTIYRWQHKNLLDISNIAFSYMTPKERHREFCISINVEFWWPIGMGASQ